MKVPGCCAIDIMINNMHNIYKTVFKKVFKLMILCFTRSTHWEQSIIHLKKAHEVEQDTSIEGKLQFKPHKENKRYMCSIVKRTHTLSKKFI